MVLRTLRLQLLQRGLAAELCLVMIDVEIAGDGLVASVTVEQRLVIDNEYVARRRKMRLPERACCSGRRHPVDEMQPVTF